MKLTLAIIHLLYLPKCMDKDTDPIFLDAIKLGAEALKAIKLTRENPELGQIVYLAGETQE